MKSDDRFVEFVLVALLAVLAVLFLVSSALAIPTQWNGRSLDMSKSYVGTGDYAVVSGKGVFYGIRVRTDGTNDVTINVYDNAAAASGTTLLPASTVINGVDGTFGFPIFLSPPIPFTSGLYVDVETAGTCSYQILYFNW